ncbi:HD-GYP domain-containing protein [Paenibacillus cremeus]|uniref:HD domain-containing protein n=1 Tax=Paenibacillus cremeus TaxID=2163881 RepID=A0A559K0A3_9BACL|nr:HD-GYP domain-containing protein [Paenibacillus cremeus]TVY05480.1 HD domain-containing protein [Paenibacillus cremeus]
MTDITVNNDRTQRLIIIGQISVYFGLMILSLRHIWVYPAKHYFALVIIMLIGFLPSVLTRYFSPKVSPYILVANALMIVSLIFTLLQEWALAGVFVLVPVFSLLFQNKSIYLFASVSSLALNVALAILFLFDSAQTNIQIVILLDVLTVFFILVFIIYFVSKDVRSRNMLEAKYLQTILTLSQSVEARDPYTQGHSERVAYLARLIADRLPELDAQLVYNCGLIHDVGKLSISDTILLKTSRLTNEEYEIMKTHTTSGAQLCNNLNIYGQIVMGVLHHHERFDGKGYPYGLRGEGIPLIARVLCVADSIDAMCSNRSYRNALGMEYVRMELEKCKSSQFDPSLVDIVHEIWADITLFYEPNLTKSIDIEPNAAARATSSL